MSATGTRKEPTSTRAASLLREIEQEFPRFLLRHKRESRLCWLIDRALRGLTLGRQSAFLTGYYTVLGYTLFVPDSWATLPDLDRVILLRHERVHLRQRRRYTAIGMAFLYLIPIFPVGLALGRARLEWEAYDETIRATAELKGLSAARALRPQILERFTGPDYAWMWPFPSTIDRWYDRVIAELEAEHDKPSGPSHPVPRDQLSSDRAGQALDRRALNRENP